MSRTPKEKKAAADISKEQEAQEVLKAQDILDKIKLVSFYVDFLKDPEEAILSRKLISKSSETMGQDITEDLYKSIYAFKFDNMIKEVVKLTGADYEQIRNPETRTAEQQFYILQLGAIEQDHRMKQFYKSLYYQALETLEHEQIKTQEDRAKENEYIFTREQAVLYFFALHEDIKPTSTNELTDDQKQELKNILYRLDNFYQKSKYNQDNEQEGFAAFSDFIEQELKPKTSKKAAAESSGALTSIGERLFLPSDPEYQDAFITKIGNSSIGLFRRDTEKSKKQLALDINTPFLQALGKIVFFDYIRKNGEHGESKIYIPALARELGYDLNEKKKDSDSSPTRSESRELFINSLLIALDNIWGNLPKDTTEYKLISVHAYNPETEVLYFVSPYLQKLISALIGKEASKIESGYHYYNWQCELMHSTAANERNPAAVEMAARLLVGLQQRGLKPNAKLKQNQGKTYKDDTEITYKITCKRLVQECPQIRERLKQQPTASIKTQTLKRTFTAMYRILKKKTDLFTYYTDVTITEVIPTMKTFDTELIIKHHGSNPNYKKPKLPMLYEDTAETQETQEV